MLQTLPLRYVLIALLALGFANVEVYRAVFAQKTLEVAVFEVGKGRAALVRSPSGKTILIDTGSDASILRGLGTTLPEWQRSIDAVILTGTKTSFTGGLPEVESRYRIKTRLDIGNIATPYGTQLAFDADTSVTVLAPGTFSISYGTNSLTVSSTTPVGVYASDGSVFKKE